MGLAIIEDTMSSDSIRTTYTCITCRVAFRDLEIQRQHYKSDWHRYNLKRKVAELPPVSVEEFQKRVIAQRGKEDELKDDSQINCKICHKSFSTKNQLENHTLSKKHKERALRIEINQPEVPEEEEEEKEEDHPMENTNKRLDAPFVESLKSVIKLAKSSGKNKKKIESEMEVDSDVESVDSEDWIDDTENPATNNDCLFCSHHSRSLLQNLKHMTLAHSFFIPDPEYCVNPKGLLIYLGEKIFAGYLCLWCNDTGKAFQTAEAAKAHMIDKGHCKMLHEGEALVEYTDFYDYSTSYPDAGENVDPDSEVEIPEIDDTDYQLVLPSGNVIGHRSLMRYYKQSLDPNRALAIPKSDKLRKVLCQYRALGWSAAAHKEAVEKKARDIKYMQRLQARYSTQLQFKANKFQKHYRPQVNF